MVKLTFAGILVIFSLTGAAYLYLPSDSQPPTPTATQPSPPPSPRPGNGREQLREPKKMPVDVAAFGLGSLGFAGYLVLSNLEEQRRNP